MKTLLKLSVFCFIFSSGYCQKVGVNTETPAQTLSVNGKIEIGDDNLPETAGTVRYSSTSSDFEGFNGSNWKSLTKQNNGLPSNPVAIYAWSDAVAPNSNVYITFSDWQDNSYTTVPENKYFIITGIYPSSESHTTSNLYYSLSIRSVLNTGAIPSFNNNSRIRLSSYDNESRPLYGDKAPLFVLKPGETLHVFNYDTSELTMHISVRGFMVDDLNF